MIHCEGVSFLSETGVLFGTVYLITAALLYGKSYLFGRKIVTVEGITEQLRKKERELLKTIRKERMKRWKKQKYLFQKSDLDASIGVFFDGFSKVIVAIRSYGGNSWNQFFPRFSEP